MKFKGATLLLLISSTLLAGCNNGPKKSLLTNSNYLFNGTVENAPLFYVPTLDEFTNLYNSNLNYIIMFAEDGCSACESFKPIIEKYVKETHQFVLLVDGEDEYEIKQQYKSKFYGDSEILTPSIFVKENGDNIYTVNYSSYMKTYNVFKRHMDSKYKTSKCAYFCEEIPGKTPIISKYSYITFQSNDVFKNKISPKLMDTQKDVVISTDFEYNALTIFEKDSSGNFGISKTNTINEEITNEIIDAYI